MKLTLHALMCLGLPTQTIGWLLWISLEPAKIQTESWVQRLWITVPTLQLVSLSGLGFQPSLDEVFHGDRNIHAWILTTPLDEYESYSLHSDSYLAMEGFEQCYYLPHICIHNFMQCDICQGRSPMSHYYQRICQWLMKCIYSYIYSSGYLQAHFYVTRVTNQLSDTPHYWTAT